MSAKLIDGKKVSEKIRREVRKSLEFLKSEGIIPTLSAIIVGENPASLVYVNTKAKACEKIGIKSEVIRLPQDASEKTFFEELDKLNRRDEISGILIQDPLPPQIERHKAAAAVDTEKDVDGFHPANLGLLQLSKSPFLPCTPWAVQKLLLEYQYSPEGKNVVILGRGNIVGTPLSIMLSRKAKGANATVTICHSATVDLASFTRSADILVSAIGKAEFVKKEMIKSGVVVIDVGINSIQDKSSEKGYRLVGDVDFESIKEIAEAITPVPGGVGPVTIALLLKNTVKAVLMKKILLYERKAPLNTSNPEFFHKWGNILYFLDEKQKALEKYEKSTAIAPNQAPAYCDWGFVLYELGQKHKDSAQIRVALSKIQKALQLQKNWAQAWYRKGLIMLALDDKKEALNGLYQAVKFDSNLKSEALQDERWKPLYEDSEFKKLIS